MLDAILETYAPHKRPQVIHLCGIPGSGKSTYARKLQQEKHPDHYILAFDQIMAQLSGYKADCRAVGLEQAFANWELTRSPVTCCSTIPISN